MFSAGAVTNERERQTLELLLTTALSPWQILSGKMLSSLRVSVVLTSFLVWPILLAWVIVCEPRKAETPESSLAVRLRWVSFCRLALSVMLTVTVKRSPTRAARWSLKKARLPLRHSEFGL